MGVTDPYPGQPADGQSLDAVPILAKFNALFQGIQSFDGSQIQAGTVQASAMASSINPNTILHDTLSNFVQSGLVWSIVSGLQGTMSSGVLYCGNGSSMFRVSVSGVGTNTFTASKDTYIDIDYNGNVTYQAVSNGATAPSLTANSVRVAKVVTNGSAITSITQSGNDGNGNYIYPHAGVQPTNTVSPANSTDPIVNPAFTTTSSTPVVIPNLSVKLATNGGSILVFFAVPSFVSTNTVTFYINIDGTNTSVLQGSNKTTPLTYTALQKMTGIAAGEHTIAIYVSITGGATYTIPTFEFPYLFAMEIGS